MIHPAIQELLQKLRSDIDSIEFDQAVQTENGWRVPVYAEDIDGMGAHSGTLSIEILYIDDGVALDYFVGDWTPLRSE